MTKLDSTSESGRSYLDEACRSKDGWFRQRGRDGLECERTKTGQGTDGTTAFAAHSRALGPSDQTAHSYTRGLADTFLAAARRISDILNSIERTAQPLHPEFDVIHDGWYWNNVKQPHRDPTHKVCVYFNDADLPLLDKCPYPAKFAENQNGQLSHKYCGFAYPRKSSDIEGLSEWAAQFPRAELCTYGQHLFGGGWKAGEVVRVIKDG